MVPALRARFVPRVEQRIVQRRFKYTRSEYFQLVNGVEAHVMFVEPPTAQVGLSTLLFVHGLATHSLKCFGNTMD